MTEAQAVKIAYEQFVSREEYPELFGDPEKFDFEIDDNSERGLMPIEEFDEKLEAYRERVAKEKGVAVEKETAAFEITEE